MRERMKIATSVFFILIAWVSFSVYDRYTFAQKISGSINVSAFPKSMWEKRCDDDWLVHSVQGKKTILRCGASFYPFYAEEIISTEEFTNYMPQEIRNEIIKFALEQQIENVAEVLR